MSADVRFAELLRDGDLVVVESGIGEPEKLVRALAAQVAELPAIEIFAGISYSGAFTPELARHTPLTSFGAMAELAPLARAGLVDVLPVHYVDVARHLRARGAGRRIVLLLRLSAAGADGMHGFGFHADYTAELVADAGLVIAEVDTGLPALRGVKVAASDVDVRIHADVPTREVPAGPVEEFHRSMAEHILPLVEDRSVIQLGIGSVPAAVAHGLAAARSGLRVHSGLVGDWLLDLHEAGALDPTAPIVIGGAAGTTRLYSFLAADPRVELRSIENLTRPDIVAPIERFVALNSAVQVDVTGQVNGEVVGGRYLGGVGGQVDFLRGAQLSLHGRSVIALPATASAGRFSRIVAELDAGTVTTPRSGVDFIVTEFGIADLRGRSIAERRQALAAIAAPQFRSGLARTPNE